MWSFPLCPEPPSWQLDWQGILAALPWLGTLAECPQNPIFHPEGNVLEHTRLVCEALVSLQAWRELDRQNRSVLFMAALLHDIGKADCTRVQDGQIVSPRHAIRGAQQARRWLWCDRDLAGTAENYGVRESIVGLVRYHGLPLRFWERPNPLRVMLEAACSTRCDYVALLAQADVQGRTSRDRPDLLDAVDEFRQFAAEQKCLQQAYAFPSDHSRVAFFRGRLEHPGTDIYDDSWGDVIMMSGLPGSGKDTWIRNQNLGWSVISLDVLRKEMRISPEGNQGEVVSRAREEARDYLRKRQKFIWNATNVSRQLRDQIVGLCLDYGARVRIVYVETNWAELVRRNRSRVNSVPEQVLSRLLEKLEPPVAVEAHHVHLGF